jgi:hypothetical protein
MTAATLPTTENREATWLRVTGIGIGTAIVGLLVLGATLTFATTTDEGDFQYGADYWLTAAALPLGVGLVLHVLGVHRLQHGRDGRLGTVGTWLFVLCSAELVVQCMASVVAGAELRWGPSYPVCAFGAFVGLALLAAGSWCVGLVPRWMLGVWPPLMLLGSWGGQGPVPGLLAIFLVAFGAVLRRRVLAARL